MRVLTSVFISTDIPQGLLQQIFSQYLLPLVVTGSQVVSRDLFDVLLQAVDCNYHVRILSECEYRSSFPESFYHH